MSEDKRPIHPLRAQRLKAGIETLDDFSVLTGIGKAYLSLLELGRIKMPRRAMREKLAVAMKIQVNDVTDLFVAASEQR